MILVSVYFEWRSEGLARLRRSRRARAPRRAPVRDLYRTSPCRLHNAIFCVATRLFIANKHWTHKDDITVQFKIIQTHDDHALSRI